MTTFYSLNDDSTYAQNAVWATVKAATAGSLVRNTTQSYCQCGWDTANYFIERGFFNFDTSSIGGSSIITAVTFNLYGLAKSGAGRAYNIFTSTCSNPVVKEDFDLVGSTALSDTAILQADWSTTGYNIWTLNATGLSAINKTGTTKLVIMETLKDVANVTPVDDVSVTYSTYQQSGTSQDPYLEVTYTAGGSSFFAFL